MSAQAPVTWITVAEAADRLRVDPKTVRRMIALGGIRARRLTPGPRGAIRIDLSSLNTAGGSIGGEKR